MAAGLLKQLQMYLCPYSFTSFAGLIEWLMNWSVIVGAKGNAVKKLFNEVEKQDHSRGKRVGLLLPVDCRGNSRDSR